MVRVLLMSILLALAIRAIQRLLAGIAEGMQRPPSPGRSRVPQRGVQMARDPVCGTFVVPDHALSLADGRSRVYFCSTACRDKYRAKSA